MIQVTVGEQKTQSEKPFPKLMKHIDGTITFFKKPKEGTHICAQGERNHVIVGYHSASIGMNDYTDFNEPITLQNL